MKRILVTGSRLWTNEAKVSYELGVAAGELLRNEPVDNPLYPQGIVVVHGGASGVDTMADQIARTYGMQVEVHPAEWRPYGIYNPQAGRFRNQKMVNAGADVCLAFIRQNSAGATHCAQAAEAAGIPVRYFREN